MHTDPDPQGFDWDGLFTLLLTLLIIGLSLGLLLAISYLYALTIARSSRCEHFPGSSLLVFGKRLSQGQVDADYRERLDMALHLIERMPQRQVILLGGTPQHEKLSEARAGLDYLVARGVTSQEHIRLEESSRNTLQNLRNARNMLQSRDANPVILITNRYHMARSRMIANSLGITHEACPAETSFSWRLSVLGKLAFEAFYMLWFTTGKNWARLIRSERMLRRVT